jgi:hypothetical protein
MGHAFTRLKARVEQIEGRRRRKPDHLTLDELRAEVHKFATWLRSCPEEDQLAFAREFVEPGENAAEHRHRFNALSPKEQHLYAETKLAMLLMEPIKNEDKAARVMNKMSSHGGGRLIGCACYWCSPLDSYRGHRDMLLGRDRPASMPTH